MYKNVRGKSCDSIAGPRHRGLICDDQGHDFPIPSPAPPSPQRSCPIRRRSRADRDKKIRLGQPLAATQCFTTKATKSTKKKTERKRSATMISPCNWGRVQWSLFFAPSRATHQEECMPGVTERPPKSRDATISFPFVNLRAFVVKLFSHLFPIASDRI